MICLNTGYTGLVTLNDLWIRMRQKIPKKRSIIVLFKGHSDGHLQFKIGYEIVNIRRCLGLLGSYIRWDGKPSFVINFGNLHLESIIHGWAYGIWVLIDPFLGKEEIDYVVFIWHIVTNYTRIGLRYLSFDSLVSRKRGNRLRNVHFTYCYKPYNN